MGALSRSNRPSSPFMFCELSVLFFSSLPHLSSLLGIRRILTDRLLLGLRPSSLLADVILTSLCAASTRVRSSCSLAAFNDHRRPQSFGAGRRRFLAFSLPCHRAPNSRFCLPGLTPTSRYLLAPIYKNVFHSGRQQKIWNLTQQFQRSSRKTESPDGGCVPFCVRELLIPCLTLQLIVSAKKHDIYRVNKTVT